MRSINEDWAFLTYSARDDASYHPFLMKIDEIRLKVCFLRDISFFIQSFQEGYVHKCGQYCKPICIYYEHRFVYGGDGNWKLAYNHCMYNLPQKHIHLNVDYPPCCTRQPLPGSAFCEEHSNTVSQLGFKTSLRGFLKDCGISGIDNKC